MSGMFRLIALGLIIGSAACEKPAGNPQSATRQATGLENDPLRELSRSTGLSIIDVSVPFERIMDAPTSLRQIADALNNGSPGIYVLRYYDDTIRHTLYIFVVEDSRSTYVNVSSLGGAQPTREESNILSASFDEPSRTLMIKTDGGSIQLTAADVTPVGA